MKILLCHERFIARYGVDRVLLALAREFRRAGHHVSLLGQTYDDGARAPDVADRVIQCPRPADTIQADVAMAEWLAEHWEDHFGSEGRPDVVLIGGWPFFSAIPIFEGRGCPVVYQDHGVIPVDGLPEIGWRTIHLIEALKRTFLREASAVVAVSAFIRDSQSRTCAAADRPLVVIPNGIDHLAPATAGGSPPTGTAPRILCPGRFEPGCYKQSELVFALERRVRTWAPEAWIAAFGSAEAIAAAAGGSGATGVIPLGQPSDAEMTRFVQTSHVVVCFSRWEGFNLPLAEAQVQGRPCLVFDLAAHREVVADPWLLCADIEEMAAKIRAFVEGAAPAHIADGSVFRSWREARERQWASVAARYLALFEECMGRAPLAPKGPGRVGHRSVVLMDVTNASRDPSNSGCVRVTRRLAAEWQRWLCVIFVVWEREARAFRFPTATEFSQLGAFQGPLREADHPVSGYGAPVWIEMRLVQEVSGGDASGPEWLVLPEIRHRPDLWPILEWAARLGLRTASIFHDAIPLERPDLVPDPAYREGHADYMRGLSRVDVCVANSRASAAALRAFWNKERLGGRVAACLLPGGLPGERPFVARGGQGMSGAAPYVLMVSTLEPRKGYRRLIEAFLAVRARARRKDWRLVLVGGRLWWSNEIAAFVEAACREHGEITWLEDAPDATLRQLYRDCAFTVYASEIEGFGLPIMESVWHGRPCLCHDAGVMRELAAGGGCLAADLLRPAVFQEALLQLMDDDELRERLAAACRARSVKRWSDFAAEFLARLACARWAELEWPEGIADPAGDTPLMESVAGRLSVIIPTYNRLDLLRTCLATLRETLPDGLDVEILVVDDASGDGTRAWLECGEGPARGVRVLRHATNRGYGYAVNRAARCASGEVLILLNHDLAFRPGWLEPMLEAARRRPGWFAVGNIQCSASDGRLDHAGIVFDPVGQPIHFRADLAWLQKVADREFPAVTFACALVDRAKFLALGGCDARYLNGCEDVDLCLRARCEGWPCVVATRSIVDHQISATPGRKLAEAENQQRFLARWQAQSVVLGRDWEERLAWERSEWLCLPDDARPAGPLRVLLDLMQANIEQAAAMFRRVSNELRAADHRDVSDTCLLVAVRPDVLPEVVARVSQADGGPAKVEVWCFIGGDAVAELPQSRIVSGPAITVARRLQADVVVACDSESMLHSPDVPLLVCPLGDEAGDARHGHLFRRVLERVQAFAGGGVSWRWTAAGRGVEGRVRLPSERVPLDKVLCCMDEPLRWEEDVPLAEIRGWVVHRDARPIHEVVVCCEDGRTFRGVMGRARPDVAAAFPAIPTAAKSGFSVRVPVAVGAFAVWAAGVDFAVCLRTWRTGDAVPHQAPA